MARYRLIDGKHVGEDGTKYGKGDVVETELELNKMFVNKFTRLADTDPTEAKNKKATKGKGKGKAGDEEVEEEETTEGELPPNQPVAGMGAVMDNPIKVPTSDLGDNVTDDFPLAKEADLQVFNKGKQFFVAKPGAPGKALNEEPLTKKEVDAFIKEA